jgi:rod shape-determining protein MreD
VQISITSSEQLQVQRFSLPATIGLPLLAILLQAYLPKYLPFFTILDLPLLVTIFFAVARRAPVTGLLTGGIIGLLQDTLGHQPIGLFGIAKTVVGYLGSSLGVKVDVENPGSRFLMTFAFYFIHQVVFLIMARGLALLPFEARWGYWLFCAFVNSFAAVPLFLVLDKTKQRV